eukprot:TRINITY_DN7404_c0_g1_i1.p1 TRINITY_DN7404_c0_g1~~TRINITY_DN7404_c0_g1_i1.p1  ORF type:complete len:452 (+),score=97.58 TRINITY_DN7404_c0_g1_i1:330-1685(+)
MATEVAPLLSQPESLPADLAEEDSASKKRKLMDDASPSPFKVPSPTSSPSLKLVLNKGQWIVKGDSVAPKAPAIFEFSTENGKKQKTDEYASPATSLPLVSEADQILEQFNIAGCLASSTSTTPSNLTPITSHETSNQTNETQQATNNTQQVAAQPVADGTPQATNGSQSQSDEDAETKRKRLQEQLAQYEQMMPAIEMLQKTKAAGATPAKVSPPKGISVVPNKATASPPKSEGKSAIATSQAINLSGSSMIHGSDGSVARLRISWNVIPTDGTNKQTLFYMENGKAQKGPPPPDTQIKVVRATKGTFFWPHFVLEIFKPDGRKSTTSEPIKLSLVGASTKLPLEAGACACLGSSAINFRQEKSPSFPLLTDTGEIEFMRLSLSCLTSKRGHFDLICLKLEFTAENSPFARQSLYSIPIEVGAKGPFARPPAKKRKASETGDEPGEDSDE